ncbi:hypothetical protein Dimus_033661, partial [Dionaea muscipula]
MPRTSHSSGRGRGRSPSDRGGRSSSDRGGSHSSTTSAHRISSADIDDYRAMTDYESMPTADSSHMPSLSEHPRTSSFGPTEIFLDGS